MRPIVNSFAIQADEASARSCLIDMYATIKVYNMSITPITRRALLSKTYVDPTVSGPWTSDRGG
jgi:hypothetical protein